MESYVHHVRRRHPNNTSPVAPKRSHGNSTPTLTYVGLSYWAVHMFLLLLLFLACRFFDERMPAPVSDDIVNRNELVTTFSETRARRFLEKLVVLGPRPSGSYECEQLATALILDEVAKIKLICDLSSSIITREMAIAKPVHFIHAEVQRPSGCFALNFLNHFVQCYQNVTNVVVRLGTSRQIRSALLLNCHFDSVPSSPGASDDGVSCSVLLEILRVLSSKNSGLPYDVVFLFNGAEENILPAAHGFITLHPLRYAIRSFINLEGAGAGGPLKSSWMLNLYLNNVPYPHTTVIGHELFQSGALPAETDFRIFRDYGRLPGIDIAFVKNGYVYHNEFDRPEYITTGCIQRAGENVLAMVNAVMQSDCMRNQCAEDDKYGVFFDMLGLFTVSYSLSISIMVNVFIIAATAAIFLIGISAGLPSSFDLRQESVWFRFYTFAHIADSLKAHGLALLGSVASGAVMLFAVSVLGNYLVWYGRSEALLSLYVAPALCGGLSVHYLFSRRFRLRDAKQVLVYEQCVFNCTLVLLAVILLVLTFWNLRSSYYFTFILLFLLMRFPLLWLSDGLVKRKSLHATTIIFAVHTLSVLPAYVFVIYGYIELSSLMVPILARVGPVVNAEKIVCIFGTATAVTAMLLMATLVYISDGMQWLRCLALYCLMYYLAISFTPYGIPFQYDLRQPRLRRIHMQHFTRRNCCNDLKANAIENWLWVYPLDMRGIKDLPNYDEIKSGHPPSCDPESTYCDLPYYIPVSRNFPASQSLLTKMEALPQAAYQTELHILNKKVLVAGSDHMCVFITPFEHWRLLNWSFNKNSAKETNGSAKFVVASQFVHGVLRYSSQLRTLMEKIHTDRLSSIHNNSLWKSRLTVDAWNSDVKCYSWVQIYPPYGEVFSFNAQ
ncbi:Peptidase M28 domain containing protein [Trichuris trichiura]|uniref:FXNA-like protease n=1 Tax=Trichuris trichiura TaxID=36087 RepID=A0A077Z2U2_TRITR|nr:Peptidase M28 domain containing protein [Trichuris trichiura]